MADELFNVTDLINQGVYPTTFSGSGIDWSSDLMQSLLPTLQNQINALPGMASDYTNQLQGGYQNMMNNALAPSAFTGTLNQLAGNNVLNSSVASNALSNTASNIANNVGSQYLDSLTAGLQQQMAVPSLLSNIANTLGQSSQSMSTNPLAVYEMMAQFLA